MNKQLAAMTAGAALALTAGATAVTITSEAHATTGVSSTSHRTSVTESFTSRTVHSVTLSKTSSIDLSKDVAHGKVIGADTTVARFHPATGIVTGEFTFVRKDGLLTGTFSIDTDTLDVTGRINGGEGGYRGVTGTVTGHVDGRKGTQITLTYQR